ncbi:hypothetical protein T05_5450 [Trichinella murrelli]|uniref:Uncharacterized protein n=1 Tax=Trichinella murrelli TaxID=144512 RepID=A0A0V0T6N1_9BILA|nr:hypothetical protein T05_5450 [Trichinella murrelli]
MGQLEYRRSTVGGSQGRVRDLDLEVRSETLGLAALIFDSVPVKCENLSQKHFESRKEAMDSTKQNSS